MVGQRSVRAGRGPVGWRRAGAAAFAALVLVSACGSSGSSGGKASGTTAPATTAKTSGSAGAQDLLGPAKQATGAPVKVGVIGDGRSPASDNTIEEDVAKDTFAFLDGYGGIGGHPVKVYTCETHGDPGGAADCANQMIQNDVVAVVIGQSQVVSAVYTPLKAAHMPTLLYGVFDKTVLADTESTFTLGNPFAVLADLPIDVAKANKVKKVVAALIDVPAATAFYETEGPAEFKKAGVDLQIVRIPVSAADVTPEMQRIVSSGQKVLVHIIGASSTCIAVLNGLHAAGFDGQVTLVQQCIDDSTRKAVPGSVLEGINMSASAPVGDPSDPGLAIYDKEIAPKVKGQVNQGATAQLMFISVMAFHSALEGITGDVTQANVITTFHGMKAKLLPGGGGVHFRCNGKAVAGSPAICVRGGLVTKLDAKGQPTTFKPVGDTPIED
jgi:branched-chain amino acid transport system substrate-binding protein